MMDHGWAGSILEIEKLFSTKSWSKFTQGAENDDPPLIDMGELSFQGSGKKGKETLVLHDINHGSNRIRQVGS